VSNRVHTALRRLDRALFGRFFDQYPRLLEREILPDCRTLLDLGCGAASPVAAFSARLGRAVGVDSFEPSLVGSRARRIHGEYRRMNVLEAEERFGPRSFDCVLASDLIEHLERPDGERLLAMMERMARRKVIVFTPNGYLPSPAVEGNAHQEHLSGWELSEMRARGYRVTGVNGWKPLRGALAAPVWRPRVFWGRVSAVSQLWTTTRPELAFSILCVKDLAPAAP
jgi:hypothetical protein